MHYTYEYYVYNMYTYTDCRCVVMYLQPYIAICVYPYM